MASTQGCAMFAKPVCASVQTRRGADGSDAES